MTDARQGTDIGTDQKTHREHVADAIAHERAARWSEASKSWAAARRSSGAETPSTSHSGLEPGTELHHTHRGVVQATCVYGGERDWRYGGKSYASASAAANAASTDLNMIVNGRVSGRKFWGVYSRRETDRERRLTKMGL